MSSFRHILEAAGDLIFTLAGDGHFTYVSSAASRLLQYDPSELVNQHYRRIIPAVWQEQMDQLIKRMFDHIDEEGVIELPLIPRQGNEIWVELMLTPLHDAVGRVDSLVGVMRDITERTLAEAELERHLNELATLRRIDTELTQQLEIGYVLSMALDTVVRLSAADAGGIELYREGELYSGSIVGHYPAEFSREYPKKPAGLVGRALEQRQPELVLDVRSEPDYIAYIPQTRAQMIIPLISQDRLIGVLFLETHNPERFTDDVFDLIQLITTRIAAAVDNAQLHDTTRRQLAELQDLYAQITALEQLKTDMIRIAAHDLGNPLTSISGYIDMLIEDNLDERQLDYARMIKDSAQQMKKIIRNILSLQRIEELAQGNLNARVDLAEVVQQVWESQRYIAAQRGQTLTLQLPEAPLTVTGDAAQLREAVVNLVGNAVKYTPDGGTITVTLKVEDDQCHFQVEDTGYGIPEDQQQRLFQPFFRVKTPEMAQIDGTGLGLHLVKNIIERHSGQMHFESVYGKGSSFSFDLPLTD